MHYMLTICSDGIATPEKAQAMEAHLMGWVDEMDSRGVRIYGHPLAPVATAKTVKVRGEQTIVTDGPWTETKELIAGFDLLDCADLDEAIEIAAKHPVAAFHSIEVRPLMSPPGMPSIEIPPASVLAGPPPGRSRYMLLIFVNGTAEPDDEEARIMREGQVWWEQVGELGGRVTGSALASAQAATTVRVSGGEAVLSDGPFAETKEFTGGFCILDCESLDQAIELAANHPIARYHRIEVRQFDGSGPER